MRFSGIRTEGKKTRSRLGEEQHQQDKKKHHEPSVEPDQVRAALSGKGQLHQRHEALPERLRGGPAERDDQGRMGRERAAQRDAMDLRRGPFLFHHSYYDDR